jgi:transposase
MDRYIGLDVHAQTTTLVVMAPSGKRLAEKVVETHGKALVDAIRSIPGQLHVCLEEGMHAEWIYELLVGRAAEVLVLIPPERTGSKSDSRDAWWLADQIRLGVPQKHAFKARLSGLREAVRTHQALVKHATRAKLQLRFLARSRGLTVERSQLVSAQPRAELLAQLPAERRPRAMLHAYLVDATEDLRQQALGQLQAQARQCPDVRRLMDVPGLGVVRAAQIVAAVVTPARFHSREQFWSYCGLAIVTRSSSDWTPRGGRMVRSDRTLTRGLMRGNPTLKCVFKSAALDVVKYYPKHPWTVALKQAVDNGKRFNLALLTLARKIAETVLHIWRHQEEYDSSKHKITPTA